MKTRQERDINCMEKKRNEKDNKSNNNDNTKRKTNIEEKIMIEK